MLRIEAEHGGKPLPELLRERHRATGNYVKVAEELGVPPATVYYWFRKFNVRLSQFVVPEDDPAPQPVAAGGDA